jgi:hypothetical protein
LSERTPFLAEVLRMGHFGIGDFAADFLQKQQTAQPPRCAGRLSDSLLNREKFPVLREFRRAACAAVPPR